MYRKTRKTLKDRITDVCMVILVVVLGLGFGWLISEAYDGDSRCIVMHCIVVK